MLQILKTRQKLKERFIYSIITQLLYEKIYFIN